MKRYITEKQNDIQVGDTVLTGKFLNKRATVKGFGTSDKGQPTLILDNGKEIQLYKVRIEKLVPKKKEK